MNVVNISDRTRRGVPAPGWTAHDQVGFELGWDYARHAVQPPVPYAHPDSALRQGLRCGRATFGERTRTASTAVHRWLQLRLNAWLRGRSVELVQVTPNYLQQIDVSHCPITRVALAADGRASAQACIGRVRDDAGYAAGNLAVMSRAAHHAKGAHGYREAQAVARRLSPLSRAATHGLTGPQWARVAVLCSFVERLPHDEACALPMVVLPPNRLRLFNPVQGVQAFVSLQLLRPGWSRRLAGFEGLLAHAGAQRDFKVFLMALLPRVIEGGRWAPLPARRWAVEDAWRAPTVQHRWAQFARHLEPGWCESLLRQATARQLGTMRLELQDDERATEGWNLQTRGYLPCGSGTPRPMLGHEQLPFELAAAP